MSDDLIELLLESELNMDHGAWATCREAAVEILRLRAENEKLREQYNAGVAAWNPVYEIVLNERDTLKAENEKLRAALEPFAEAADDFISEKHDMTRAIVSLGDLRAAAAALKGTGDE